VWVGLIWLRKGTMLGSLQPKSEPLTPIRGREFLEQLSNHQILSKFSNL
jgi:hypothetical protein